LSFVLYGASETIFALPTAAGALIPAVVPVVPLAILGEFAFAAVVPLAAFAAQAHVRFLNGRDVANAYQEDVSAKVENADELIVDANHKTAHHALVVGVDPNGLIQQAAQPFDQTKLHLIISFAFHVWAVGLSAIRSIYHILVPRMCEKKSCPSLRAQRSNPESAPELLRYACNDGLENL